MLGGEAPKSGCGARKHGVTVTLENSLPRRTWNYTDRGNGTCCLSFHSRMPDAVQSWGAHPHHLQSSPLLSSLSFSPLYIKKIIRLLIPSVGKKVETRDPHSLLLRRCTATPLWKAISQSPVKLKALIYRPDTNPTHITRVCKERVKEPPLLQPCLEHQKNGKPPKLSTAEQWNTLHQQK